MEVINLASAVHFDILIPTIPLSPLSWKLEMHKHTMDPGKVVPRPAVLPCGGTWRLSRQHRRVVEVIYHFRRKILVI